VKATIDTDGNLKIEMQSIVESMSERDLRTLAKYAVFQEVLLKGVIDALVKNNMWTDDDEEPAWWFSSDTFNKMRLQLLPLLPEITVMAVQHLEREVRHAKGESNAWRDVCWKLERQWRESQYPPDSTREVCGRDYERPMTKEQVGAYLTELTTKLATEAKEPSRG